MPDTDTLSLLDEFAKQRGRYVDLAASIAALVDRLIREAGITVHSVSHRAKELTSFREKLSRPNKTYGKLDDITDLAGVRITTYFASDVDLVAQIVERELQIDSDNSIDKRAALDPDRFGYLSLHYVASVGPDRLALSEYARLRGMKFEIQIRSILQHAWAEIEHDLGYKSKGAVPRTVQRRFARVASLLELADAEFSSLRDELAAYATQVEGEIRTAPETVAIDKVSLGAYIIASELARQLDEISARQMKAQLHAARDMYIELTAREVLGMAIPTVGALNKEVEAYLPWAPQFIEELFPRSTSKQLSRGIGIGHMMYAVAARAGKTRVLEYLNEFRIGYSGKDRESFASRIVAAYQKAKGP
jgi:putative GTP pyrophosphokinase